MNSRDDFPQGYLMNRRAFVSMVAAGAVATANIKPRTRDVFMNAELVG